MKTRRALVKPSTSSKRAPSSGTSASRNTRSSRLTTSPRPSSPVDSHLSNRDRTSSLERMSAPRSPKSEHVKRKRKADDYRSDIVDDTFERQSSFERRHKRRKMPSDVVIPETPPHTSKSSTGMQGIKSVIIADYSANKDHGTPNLIQ